MIHFLIEQDEAERAFRLWANEMLAGSIPIGGGWRIEGRGVAFSNHGHGAPGTIDNEVMLPSLIISDRKKR